MNFTEFLAKLGSAVTKTLTDAKALLTEAHTMLAAAVAEIEAKASALSVAEASLITARAELATANANLVTANASITELTEKAATIETGTLAILKSAGLAVEKLDKEAITTATKKRAEALGHELLAARGIKPLPEQLNDALDTVATADLSTDEKILAAYDALPLGTPAREQFFAKHEAAIWRAWKAS
jgi:hypothetical protein